MSSKKQVSSPSPSHDSNPIDAQIIPSHSQSPALTRKESGASDTNLSFGGVPLSEDDRRCLDEFCADLSYHAVSYEDFIHTHQGLDLLLLLPLSAAQCQAGGRKTITFTRTIQTEVAAEPGATTAPESVRQRHQVSCEVSWPSGISWDDTIRLHHLGDQQGATLKGDVIVRIVPLDKDSAAS